MSHYAAAISWRGSGKDKRVSRGSARIVHQLLMKHARLIALAFSCALTAPLAAQTLPGVSDEETTIYLSRGGIEQIEFGEGDIAFVRDGTNRWYRIAFSEGCLTGNFSRQDPAVFDTRGGNRVDRLTTVRFPRSGRSCLIDSIRRSETPPMMDSKSRVPID